MTRRPSYMNLDTEHTFVTSDHHFGLGTKEEEDELVRKWNSVVGPNDTVIYAGDFADCCFLDMVEYRKRLNGEMILVKGNHDNLPDEAYLAIFKEVYDRLVLQDLGIFVCHCPDSEYAGPLKQIYGHLHEGGMFNEIPPEKGFCVCVMRHDGYPVRLDNILEKLE